MEKYTSAIEISSKKIKLVVGYELNGQVYVIYTLCKPLDSIVNAGTTEDRVEVISSLNNFANIYDESANMSLTIPSVVLSIPPFGLEVYNAVQDTPV